MNTNQHMTLTLYFRKDTSIKKSEKSKPCTTSLTERLDNEILKTYTDQQKETKIQNRRLELSPQHHYKDDQILANVDQNLATPEHSDIEDAPFTATTLTRHSQKPSATTLSINTPTLPTMHSTNSSSTNFLPDCCEMTLSPRNQNPLLLCCAECIRCQVSCWWSCWWPCCEWSDCCPSSLRHETSSSDEEIHQISHN